MTPQQLEEAKQRGWKLFSEEWPKEDGEYIACVHFFGWKTVEIFVMYWNSDDGLFEFKDDYFNFRRRKWEVLGWQDLPQWNEFNLYNP